MRPKSGELASLVNVAMSQGNGKWQTNIPVTIGTAMYLMDQFSGATHGWKVVFKPKFYATHITGTSAYQLKIDQVRNWAALHLK